MNTCKKYIKNCMNTYFKKYILKHYHKIKNYKGKKHENERLKNFTSK